RAISGRPSVRGSGEASANGPAGKRNASGGQHPPTDLFPGKLSNSQVPRARGNGGASANGPAGKGDASGGEYPATDLFPAVRLTMHASRTSLPFLLVFALATYFGSTGCKAKHETSRETEHADDAEEEYWGSAYRT